MTRDHNYRLRYVSGVAVVATGRYGAGEPFSGAALLALVEQKGSRIVFDIPSDGWIDSAVIGLLLTLHRKSVASGSRIRLVVPEGATREVFGITKLDSLFGPYWTLADALHDF